MSDYIEPSIQSIYEKDETNQTIVANTNSDIQGSPIQVILKITDLDRSVCSNNLKQEDNIFKSTGKQYDTKKFKNYNNY